jgi:hypothetical protein
MDGLLNSADMARKLGITKQSFFDGVRTGRFTPHSRAESGVPLFDPVVVGKQYAGTKDQCEIQDRARDLPKEMRGGRPSGTHNKNAPIDIDRQKILQVKLEKEAAQAKREATQEKLAALKYKIQKGLYIEKAEAERQGVELGTMIMGVLQSWPSRMAPEFAAMHNGDEHDFLQKLEEEINQLIIAIRKKCGFPER